MSQFGFTAIFFALLVSNPLVASGPVGTHSTVGAAAGRAVHSTVSQTGATSSLALDESTLEPLGPEYPNLYWTDRRIAARAVDGKIYLVQNSAVTHQYRGSLGNVPLTLESLQEIVRKFQVWLDSEPPPEAEIAKSVTKAIKATELALSLSRVEGEDQLFQRTLPDGKVEYFSQVQSGDRVGLFMRLAEDRSSLCVGAKNADAEYNGCRVSPAVTQAFLNQLYPQASSNPAVRKSSHGKVLVASKMGTLLPVELGPIGRITAPSEYQKVSPDVQDEVLRVLTEPWRDSLLLRRSQHGDIYAENKKGKLERFDFQQPGKLLNGDSFPEETLANFVFGMEAELNASGNAEAQKTLIQNFLKTDLAERYLSQQFEDFSELFRSPSGKIFGRLSDGAIRELKIAEGGGLPKAVDAPKGAIIPALTLNQLASLFSTQVKNGELKATSKHLDILTHHQLIQQEQGAATPALVHHFQDEKKSKPFLLKTLQGSTQQPTASAISLSTANEPGEFVRNGQKIPYKAGDTLADIPGFGKYRVQHVLNVDKKNLPLGMKSAEELERLVNEGHTDFEMSAIAAMNNYRASRGLLPVSPLKSLTPFAWKNSDLQANTGNVGHPAQNGMPEIAFVGPTDVQSLINGWAHSPAHNAIMLGGYTKVGLSYVAKRNQNGLIYHAWTAVFQ